MCIQNNIKNPAQPDSRLFCFNEAKWLPGFSEFLQTGTGHCGKRKIVKVFLPIGY